MSEQTKNTTGNQSTAIKGADEQTPKVEYQMAWPYPGAVQRLNNYDYYEKLFFGQHFDAFNARINHPDWHKQYARIKYIVANFAGLLSKVSADFLFSEPPRISVEPEYRDWFMALQTENKLDVQNYESALQNSYMGDAVYKLRVGKRHPNDKEATVIIEDVNPKCYFPSINPSNVRDTPTAQELAYVVEVDNVKYIRKEIHEPGKIRNELWKVEKGKLVSKEPLSIIDKDLKDEEDTKVDRSLVIHIKNWGVGSSYFGMSDYHDLDSLFYALNNRLTKTENILDKHADPILALPEGVLDENGEVNRAKLGVFEVPPSMGGGAAQKPEYIVWNASLESSFKHIEKLVEMMFMMSEVSPDVLGMGQGQSDTGRALKYKLLRTLAKVARKRTYYDGGLKEVFYVAQLLAKAHGVKVGGFVAPSKPIYPEIKWFDGIPVDESEQIENEAARLDAGLTTKADSLMRLDNLEEDEAEKKAKEIKDEQTVELPAMKIGDPNFGKTQPGKPAVVPKEGANGK